MITAQAAELLWVVLSYIGSEHSKVTANGTLHLDHLPYSHSLLIGLGGGAVVWASVRWFLRRPDLAAVFGLVYASHIVLDVIQHEPDIRILPWLSHPTVGMNLQANPWLDFAVETLLCLACWAHYRGSRQLLVAVVVLNVANLPLMLAGDGGAQNMAGNRFVLPTVILGTIVLAAAVIHRYAALARLPRQRLAQRPPQPASRARTTRSSAGPDQHRIGPASRRPVMSTTDVIDLATRIQRRRDFTAHLTGFISGAVVLGVLFAAGIDPALKYIAAILTWGTALSFQHFRQVLRGPVTTADVNNEVAQLGWRTPSQTS